MSAKLSKTSILQQYEESGRIMYEATLSGDYKTNNKEGDKLIKIFKIFENDRKLAHECIAELLKSSNVVVRTKAAAYCLALNEATKIAEDVLEEIANNKRNGIFGFNAKMTLQVWRENGKLEIYQKE